MYMHFLLFFALYKLTRSKTFITSRKGIGGSKISTKQCWNAKRPTRNPFLLHKTHQDWPTSHLLQNKKHVWVSIYSVLFKRWKDQFPIILTLYKINGWSIKKQDGLWVTRKSTNLHSGKDTTRSNHQVNMNVLNATVSFLLHLFKHQKTYSLLVSPYSFYLFLYSPDPVWPLWPCATQMTKFYQNRPSVFPDLE